ncbi:MAG: glycosyltransferase [Elusimicrobia bacterium]|nr:glycosyltransferase [Elusimicrobiota bacterium]
MGPGENAPGVSVIVISKDRHELLLKSITALRELRYPADSYEIVVVEEGDGPLPIDGVHYVFLPRRNLGLGYARNMGLDAAKGEIIAFTDDDTRVDPDWLSELAAPFADPAVNGVAGLTRAQESGLIGETEEILGVPGGGIARLLSTSGELVETRSLSACNCAYRGAVARGIRFKEDSYGRIGGEDWYMAEMVCSRGKCVFTPRAVVYHKPRADLFRLVHTFYRREACAHLAAREYYHRSRTQYFTDKGFGLVTGRILSAAVIAALAGPLWLPPLFVLYYFAVLWKKRRLFPLVRHKPAFFLVPLTNLAVQAGILKAELEILFTGGTKAERILRKF